MNSTGDVPDGTTGEMIPENIPVWMAIAAFTAVAWYNVIELNIQVFLTFKRHRGLYFWSLIISSYGCVLHALGILLKLLQLTSNNFISVTILTVGWYAMVTGQAIVLYSRLHLVVRDHRVLRAVLLMIIIDAICLHIPTTVLTYALNVRRPVDMIPHSLVGSFDKMERVQMTFFCIQEFIISGIYIYSTIRLLRPVYHGRTRRVMMQLIWINLIIIGMDVVLLVMEYSSQYTIQATLKAMVYSIKLKLEFGVLNQLMTLANSSVSNATKLTFAEDHEVPPAPALKGRSKSLSYLSRQFSKSTRSRTKSPHEKRADSVSTETTWSSLGLNNNRRIRTDWVPSLDRKRTIEPQHIEYVNDPHNVFTNPAACFHPEGQRRHRRRDALSEMIDTPTSPLSPALTGSTLNHSTSNPSRLSERRSAAPPPLDLNTSSGIGVLRSNRPSVSDWAHGPDSASSPSCSDQRLTPYEMISAGLHRETSTRQGRGRNMGLDFMTSAI
ncbi:MAG: hypothetical protein Q9187_008897 [Circinaria calcarea]